MTHAVLLCMLVLSALSSVKAQKFYHEEAGANSPFIENLDYTPDKQMSWDSKNRPYILSESGVKTLRNGRWVNNDYRNVIENYFNGDLEYIHMSYARLAIDSHDNLYLIIRVRRQINGEGKWCPVLLFMQDVVNNDFETDMALKDVLPQDYIPMLESNICNNDHSLYPPMIIMQDYYGEGPYNTGHSWAGCSWGRYYMVDLEFDSTGDIELDTLMLINDKCGYLTEHSGGHNAAVTHGSKIWVTYMRHDSDPLVDPNGNNAVYISQYDRSTNTFDIHNKFLFESDPEFADGHSTPVLAVDMDGYIHVQGGAHAGDGFKYAKSVQQFDANAFTSPVVIGSGRTYSELLIDDNNIMYSAFRAGNYQLWMQKGSAVNGFTNDNGFLFADQNCPHPYRGWYQRLYKDRSNNKYITWTALCDDRNNISDFKRVIAGTVDGENWLVPTRYNFLERCLENKQVQKITSLSRNYFSTSENIEIAAESDANLPIFYQINSGNATSNNNTITPDGNEQEIDLTIFNDGNATYYGDEINNTISIKNQYAMKYASAAFTSMAAGDFDGDGIDEVAVLRAQGGTPWINDQNRIVTLNINQNRVINNFHLASFNFHYITSGDFNNDGIDELVGCTTGPTGAKNRIVIFNGCNGNIMYDWTNGGAHFSSIAAGDIDNDGNDEVLFLRAQGGSPWVSTQNTIFACKADGTYYTAFRVGTEDITGIVAGNFDNDNNCEIVAFNNNRLRVIDSNGGVINDWTYGGVHYTDIAVINADSDAQDEIAVIRAVGGTPWNNNAGRVLIWEADNTLNNNTIISNENNPLIVAGNFDGVSVEEIATLKMSDEAILNEILFTKVGSAATLKTANADFQFEKGVQEDVKSKNVITIYPNPIKDVLNIQGCFMKNSYMKIYDLRGKLILNYPLGEDNELTNLSISHLAKGFYIVTVIDDVGKMNAIKIQKD